jgi:hypothetical protein
MPQTDSSKRFALTICLWLMLGSLLTSAHGSGADSGTVRFDAKWWSQAHSDEQQGFIYGYIDCRQPQRRSTASIVDYQNAVSATMDSQKTSDPNAVTKAVEHAWKTLKPQAVDKSAEVYAGPHGYLDGEWWGGFEGRPRPSHVADADRGYLEGYLECSSPPVTLQDVRRYQTILNQHYVSGHHTHDKIANVLQPLLQSSAPPNK